MGFICFMDEIEHLSSTTAHLSLRQRLRNVRWFTPRAPNQTHALIEWISTAIFSMWTNVGELLETVSKWHIFAELMQIVRELGMKLFMFNLNTQGRWWEFYSSMWDAILNNTPSTSFGPLMAILVPCVGHPIYRVTSMVGSLREVEGQWQAKWVRSVKTPKGQSW